MQPLKQAKQNPAIVRYEEDANIAEVAAEPQGPLRSAVTLAPAPLEKKNFTAQSNITPLGAQGQQKLRQLRGDAPSKPRYASRVSYKLQRLWLTPFYQFLAKKIVPLVALILIGFYLAGYRSIDEFRGDMVQKWNGVMTALQTRPEFMINTAAISGGSPALNESVRAALGVSFPQSSLNIDLFSLRQKIESLGAVKSVELAKRTGGILDVIITPRVPVVVMKRGNALVLLDAEGVVSGTIATRRDRLDLPLIAGLGAEKNLDEGRELLSLIQTTAPEVAARILGLVRIGERRWDILLSRAQVIQLPENNPTAALTQVLGWQDTQDILNRDLHLIDLRNPDRPVVRLSEPALKTFQEAQNAILTGRQP